MIRARVQSFAVLSTALLVLSSFAVAQERRGRGGLGRGGRGFGALDKTVLLRSDQVKKELKIDEGLSEKIGAALEAHREESREVFAGRRGLRDLPEEERAKKMAEMNAKREQLTAATVKKLEGMLSGEQVKRLNEIFLQHSGTQGLTDKSVVAALKLSEEQVEGIKAAVQWGRDEQSKLFQGFRRGEGGERPDFNAIREKREKITKEIDSKIMAVLSKEQQESLKNLKGEPFELDRRSLFGGRGRGGEGRRGRGGEGRSREGRGERRRSPSDGDNDI